jgi:hypothetical protein
MLLEVVEVQKEQGTVLYCVVHSVVVLRLVDGLVETAAVDEAGGVDGVTVAIVIVRVVELVLEIV